jgi:hypothetical protein
MIECFQFCFNFAFKFRLRRYSKGGNHCHMNCVPVPRARAGKARKIFDQAAARLNFEWVVIPAPESAVEAQSAIKAGAYTRPLLNST